MKNVLKIQHTVVASGKLYQLCWLSYITNAIQTILINPLFILKFGNILFIVLSPLPYLIPPFHSLLSPPFFKCKIKISLVHLSTHPFTFLTHGCYIATLVNLQYASSHTYSKHSFSVNNHQATLLMSQALISQLG